MQPLQLFDDASSTFTYILFDPASREAVLIDPVDAHLERDLATLREHGLTLRWALETHNHADHITSAAALAQRTGATLTAPALCGIQTATVRIKPGDELPFGAQRLRALATPGHTAGSLSYTWTPVQDGQPQGSGHVFTGDALLINGCGRTDFQSGSARALYHSLTQVLFKLPPDTVVWPAHDYKGRTHSTIGAEMAGNERVAGKTEAEFIELMHQLNLPLPERLAESVPANLRSGQPHEAGAPGNPAAIQPGAGGYAGDISPNTAYAWWQAGGAKLVDVRSDAEREWVGFVPGAVPVVWKQWPGMVLNAEFDAQLRAVATTDRPLLMLCRSGVRSIGAAQRATQLGYEAYNILEGFEGDLDTLKQRGQLAGWRHRGLPWQQS